MTVLHSADTGVEGKRLELRSRYTVWELDKKPEKARRIGPTPILSRLNARSNGEDIPNSVANNLTYRPF
jgi:hypothetical protein